MKPSTNVKDDIDRPNKGKTGTVQHSTSSGLYFIKPKCLISLIAISHLGKFLFCPLMAQRSFQSQLRTMYVPGFIFWKHVLPVFRNIDIICERENH